MHTHIYSCNNVTKLPVAKRMEQSSCVNFTRQSEMIDNQRACVCRTDYFTAHLLLFYLALLLS